MPGKRSASRDPYDDFAWFYEPYWASMFVDTALHAVETLVLPYIPIRGRVLDVCCGSGELASELASRGYRVAGLDRSFAMLSRARVRTPEALWVRADARAFSLAAVHHAAFCFFDSLNHLLAPEDLRKAFGCVRGSLRRGGLFLFDLNTEEAFGERWVGRCDLVRRHGLCRVEGHYDAEERIGVYRFHLRGRGETAGREAEFEIRERCHRDDEVREALAASGLRLLEIVKADTDLGFEEEAGRLFYLAERGRRAARSKE